MDMPQLTTEGGRKFRLCSISRLDLDDRELFLKLARGSLLLYFKLWLFHCFQKSGKGKKKYCYCSTALMKGIKEKLK